jgi:hypothetical protein
VNEIATILAVNIPDHRVKIPPVSMNKLVGFAILVALMIGFPCFVRANDDPPERQLANIDAKQRVADDDITIARFRSLLDQLSEAFSMRKQDIADKTVVIQQLLRKEGVEEKMLNMMEGINRIFPGRAGDWKYDTILAYYATFRVKGRSHSEAIEGIVAVVRLAESGR